MLQNLTERLATELYATIVVALAELLDWFFVVFDAIFDAFGGMDRGRAFFRDMYFRKQVVGET